MDLKGIAHEEKEKAWEFNPLAGLKKSTQFFIKFCMLLIAS